MVFYCCFGLLKRNWLEKLRVTPSDLFNAAAEDLSCVDPVCASEMSLYLWKLLLKQYFNGAVLLIICLVYIKCDFFGTTPGSSSSVYGYQAIVPQDLQSRERCVDESTTHRAGKDTQGSSTR